MQKKIRKKLGFFLVAFFVFSYQFANPPPNGLTTVEASEFSTVILGGRALGININVDGIMILGFSEFETQTGKKCCPAKEAGLRENDIIISVNGEQVLSASQFSTIVDKYEDSQMDMEYLRNGEKHSATVTAVKTSDGEYHLGLWARDGTSGLGTLTFVDSKTKKFGALGHGVTDGETDRLIAVGRSNIYLAHINSVEKSLRSNPGELQGSFISSEIGNITENTNYGIYGKLTEDNFSGQEIAVASRGEIKLGEAKINCCIDGDNVESFSVEIKKINTNSNDNKSMTIEVTDEKLISRTGGIVQGMSGAPIVQNGKLIGAVTHVCVNNPTKGYGIFIEKMLDETMKIK